MIHLLGLFNIGVHVVCVIWLASASAFAFFFAGVFLICLAQLGS